MVKELCRKESVNAVFVVNGLDGSCIDVLQQPIVIIKATISWSLDQLADRSIKKLTHWVVPFCCIPDHQAADTLAGRSSS